MTDERTYAQKRAEKFGLNIDPLADFEEGLRELEDDGAPDPLEDYLERIQRRATDNTPETVGHYERTFRQWRDHMKEVGRHPACPNKYHVLSYIDYWLDQGNKPSTVRSKVERLSYAYEWWQSNDEYPHTQGHHPFDQACDERHLRNTDPEDQTKKPPHVPLDEVREVVQSIDHIGDRSIIGLQLKLGCRSSELGNIRISEIHLDHPDVQKHYPEMGSHEMLDGRPNAVFIPHTRDLNKRERPTVLPLDEEARRLLINWLLVRPDTGDPHLFMTHKGKKLTRTDIRYKWTKYWWPEYEFDKGARYRSVVPHFARHRFSTYWKSDLDGINREYIKYMRGDKTDTSVGTAHDALDHYVHTYYEDVEQLYRDKMYSLFI